MTDAEKLTLLQKLTGETDTALLSACLSMAGQKVLNKAYPFDDTITEVPDKYGMVQVTIADYIYSKRGATGETAHKENGIDRTYESADVPPSMLKEVIPYCGGIKSADA